MLHFIIIFNYGFIKWPRSGEFIFISPGALKKDFKVKSNKIRVK